MNRVQTLRGSGIPPEQATEATDFLSYHQLEFLILLRQCLEEKTKSASGSEGESMLKISFTGWDKSRHSSNIPLGRDGLHVTFFIV